jgi:hypothetical protein
MYIPTYSPLDSNCVEIEVGLTDEGTLLYQSLFRETINGKYFFYLDILRVDEWVDVT